MASELQRNASSANTCRLAVEKRVFLRGCSGGIDEKTVLVDVSVTGDFPADELADQRIRAAALALCPEQPLYRIAESDWPTAFLLPSVAAVDSASVSDPAALWLGRWIVALTVAIQQWGRDPVWRGKVITAEPQRLRLAIPWQRDRLFNSALKVSLEVLGNTVRAQPGTEPSHIRLSERFGDSWDFIQTNGMAPETLRFIQAGLDRDMPFQVRLRHIQLGWGVNAERLDMAFTGRTSGMAAGIAKDKWRTKALLAKGYIPVPRGHLLDTVEQAEDAVATDLGWPVVVKPFDRELGEAVTVGIANVDALRRAFDEAAAVSDQVLVEQHVEGADHRLLVVGGRYLAAARRLPARVIGDGVHTVEQLVAAVNADPRRGSQRYSLLKKIELDAVALECLAAQCLDRYSVLEPGRIVALRRIANISSGGTAEEITDVVHPDNRALAERAARLIGLDIAGIDFLTTDITRSWREVGGAICEVNAQPGLRPHWLAAPDRDINGEILDRLFAGRPSRIPTAAISGTNGKTTTAEMLFHIWMTAGKLTGVCTTVSLRIGHDVVRTDNLSGEPGARSIISDTAAEAAVFEMPRKGMIIFGHACDHYDVAALLNVQVDHLGEFGVDTLEQMAVVKAQVLARARHAIVVNADDPLCMAMRSEAGTDRHLLVTRDAADPAVVEHRRLGGEAVFLAGRIDNPRIVLARGAHEETLMAAHDIPATMNGLLSFNVSNAMFAAALAWAQGVEIATIRRALGTFHTSVEQNPGRCNFVEGLPFQVVIDFAHNPDGIREICKVAAGLPVTGRKIVCSQGRTSAHFPAFASDLAYTFDEFVLGCKPNRVDPPRESPDPVSTLASMRRCLVNAGVRDERITSVADPAELVPAALAKAHPGDLLVLLVETDTARPAIDEYRNSLRS